jgi:predicted ATPase/DNA-binding winged helix-turn-helix (wHTH) protein
MDPTRVASESKETGDALIGGSSVSTSRQSFSLVKGPWAHRAHSLDDAETGSISFGAFRLLPTRQLLRAGKAVSLGSRALDILIVLLERPGELVGKDELMARVWPKTFVEPANLTVHIAALRRALGDGRDGNRFLVNTPGRGYRFVAPVAFDMKPSELAVAASKPKHNLPARLTPLVGRDNIVDDVAKKLSRVRLLTVVGPPGVGKTSVAFAAAQQVFEQCDHDVRMIDLAAFHEPQFAAAPFAEALGLEIRSEEQPLPKLLAALGDKPMLLVLDNCAHVVGAAAEFALNVLRRVAGARILATSREPLCVEGENVYRLSPLDCPRVASTLTAAEALTSPAARLFAERAAASLRGFELDDGNASVVAEICRNLDGVPLAIEVAAARVGAIGLEGVAACLTDPLGLLADGYRTKPPRQRTMGTAIDWSFELLTDLQKSILRRLSVFAGAFTLQAAARVAADLGHSESEIVGNVLELVDKSLIMTDGVGRNPQLRLLGTTRIYVKAKLADADVAEKAVRRRSKLEHDPCANGARSLPNLVGEAESFCTACDLGRRCGRGIQSSVACLGWTT